MESEFIALDKAEKKQNGFDNFWNIYYYGQSQCPLYAFTAIIKQLYLRHKILYISVSLDIFVVDNTVKQLLSNEIISIDFVSSKDNLVDPFTKRLSGERINYASRGMGLKV